MLEHNVNRAGRKCWDGEAMVPWLVRRRDWRGEQPVPTVRGQQGPMFREMWIPQAPVLGDLSDFSFCHHEKQATRQTKFCLPMRSALPSHLFSECTARLCLPYSSTWACTAAAGRDGLVTRTPPQALAQAQTSSWLWAASGLCWSSSPELSCQLHLPQKAI